MIYLIGSLRNPKIPSIAAQLRQAGYEVFDDWYAAGPEADDRWKAYEKGKGHTYLQALQGPSAKHVFDFDVGYLYKSRAVVLALPAGKSAHMELGWALGQGKPGHILLEPNEDRWDVMYQFATGVHDSMDSLLKGLADG